ncbi:MAG TPA: hypothetical protein DCZ94_01895, partial [Lentisphaeria bacterium]|nr:hypothetical protein [Lentisphaeria bacterium]
MINIKQGSTLLRMLAIVAFLVFLWQAYMVYFLVTFPPPGKSNLKFPHHYDNDIERKYGEKYENSISEFLGMWARRKIKLDIRYHLLFSISSLVVGILLLGWAHDRRKLEKQGIPATGESIPEWEGRDVPMLKPSWITGPPMLYLAIVSATVTALLDAGYIRMLHELKDAGGSFGTSPYLDSIVGTTGPGTWGLRGLAP